jgi:hypothetical protein
MVCLLGQQPTFSGDNLGQFLQFGLPGVLLIWMITKAFPALLERSDRKQEEALTRFEGLIYKIESNRVVAAKDGHDAARALSKAIEEQCEAIRGNSQSLDRLAGEVTKSHG